MSAQFENRKYKRRSIRLRGYDYSQVGAYFVTICTHNHEILFEDDRIMKIAEEEWLNTSDRRCNVILDEYVIMPNHLHGIIIIRHPVGAYCNTPLRQKSIHPSEAHISVHLGPTFRSPSQSLGSIIRGFKASSTKKINILRGTPHTPVWQRNYYDHVIRDESDLFKKRKYIRENAIKRAVDENQPFNIRCIEKN